MIHWIQYDPANPPAEGRYLITDGENWTAGVYDPADAEWWAETYLMDDSDVTHYAHINLPGEDKADGD